MLSQPHLHWKYWDEHPGWAGSRSYVMTEAGEIVAHAALVPLSFARGGRTFTLVQLLDWAASPRHVGAGVSLLQHMARLADGVLNVRASAMARRIFHRLGYRPLGHTTRYVLSLPAASAPPGVDADVIIHTPAAFMRAAPHPLESTVSRANAIVLRRSLATFEAFLRCPAVSAIYGEVHRDGRLLGTFVLAEAPGQLRLVDAWADVEQAGAWDIVLAAVIARAADHTGISELVTQTNDPVQMKALEAAGFFAAESDPLSVLASRSVVPDGAYVRHQLLDSDLAYLHHNVPDLWGQSATA